MVNPVPESGVVEVNKSRMLVHPKNGAIHRELFLYKKREPICTDFLMRHVVLKEGDVVLDIGANIGYYVLVESQLIGENCGQAGLFVTGFYRGGSRMALHVARMLLGASISVAAVAGAAAPGARRAPLRRAPLRRAPLRQAPMRRAPMRVSSTMCAV